MEEDELYRAPPALSLAKHICTVTRQSKRIKKIPHSINLQNPDSALRIQLQTDQRYQAFITNASLRNVMGYEMMVAALAEVLQGKVWAYLDSARRKSKRQKDLADVFRLVESYPHLREHLPETIQQLL